MWNLGTEIDWDSKHPREIYVTLSSIPGLDKEIGRTASANNAYSNRRDRMNKSSDG